MSERLREIPDGKCDKCGTTIIRFDPPLVFEPAEACGALKPGNYAAIDDLPVCDMPAGHDGKHAHLVERLDTWADDSGVPGSGDEQHG